MNAKDEHEINYWLKATPEILQEELDRLRLMETLFPLPESAASVLEIGVGPQGGLLPFIDSPRKVGIDPLFSKYAELGFVQPAGAELVEEYFERWNSDERFEVILCTNALDHGEMGFGTMGLIVRHLLPGGRLYLHVHLRPPHLLNAGHDHCLSVDQLDYELMKLPLVELKREFFDHDVDGKFNCRALVGIWQLQ